MKKLFLIPASDGHRIALWKMSENTGPAVLLTHGTFSNHRSCIGLAERLATQGFSPWIFDWRGHGGSDMPKRPHNFEDVAALDIPAALAAVTEFEKQDKVFFVGHSGGGLAACMWMARNPLVATRQLHGIVLLASQTTHAARSYRKQVVIGAVNLILSMRKTAPGHHFGIGPEPESAPLMRQWCKWNLSRRFNGIDGFDYLKALDQVKLPVLALAGGGDLFIAPAAGCQLLAHSFGGDDVTFLHCGKADGYQEDYTHDRLILSKPASHEIWPLIDAWLSKISAASG